MPTEPDPTPPPMSEAMLDEESVAALFRDIAALTTIDEIIIKDRPGRVDDQQHWTLADAERLIRDGTVRGVQVRYRHEGLHWWDTLMRTREGIRLVRVRHEFENR